jgi:hypothetical protein
MPDANRSRATIPARASDDETPDLAALAHQLLIELARKNPMPKQTIFAFEAPGARTLYGRADSAAEAGRYANYLNTHRISHFVARELSIAEGKRIPAEQVFDIAAERTKHKVTHRPIFQG